jgi:hypothetical protein
LEDASGSWWLVTALVDRAVTPHSRVAVNSLYLNFNDARMMIARAY